MDAIVLAKRDYRESDQVISFLTRDRGRQELVAKGSKKITSKNAAHLEPFSCVEITMEPGKGFSYVTSVQGLAYFSAIRSDLQKSTMAMNVCDLVHRSLQIGEEDQQVFALLLSWLDELGVQPASQLLYVGFVLQFISLLGFHPAIPDVLPVREQYVFSLTKASIVDDEVGEHFICSKEDIALIRFLLHSDWSEIAAKKASAELISSVHQFVSRYASFHLEREVEFQIL